METSKEKGKIHARTATFDEPPGRSVNVHGRPSDDLLTCSAPVCFGVPTALVLDAEKLIFARFKRPTLTVC